MAVCYDQGKFDRFRRVAVDWNGGRRAKQGDGLEEACRRQVNCYKISHYPLSSNILHIYQILRWTAASCLRPLVPAGTRARHPCSARTPWMRPRPMCCGLLFRCQTRFRILGRNTVLIFSLKVWVQVPCSLLDLSLLALADARSPSLWTAIYS